MSTARKYANLPDLDLAPDVYETPDLTEDNSTIPTSHTHRSDSPYSEDFDDAGEDAAGISQQRIDPDRARSRFLSDDERRAIHPSRVGDKRRGHQHSQKSRTAENDGILNGVDGRSDEGQAESVARKLARLRQEILELQSQIQQENEDLSRAANDSEEAEEAETAKLVALLNAAEASRTKPKRGAATRLLGRVEKKGETESSLDPGITEQKEAIASEVETEKNVPHANETTHAMVARLDARLKGLEDILGLDLVPQGPAESVTIKPLLPALDALDKQFTTLATSSEHSIERIRDRVQGLANDAGTLELKRSQARKALEALTAAQARSGSRSGNPQENTPKIDIAEDHEQVLKINALYGTLGTIDSIAPVLLPVLERLRSLRDLHANAANASQDLSDLEREQQALQEELRVWKQGVENIEKAVAESHVTLKENTETVEEWVQELEQRIKDLK